jgi:hypothetical protein
MVLPMAGTLLARVANAALPVPGATRRCHSLHKQDSPTVQPTAQGAHDRWVRTGWDTVADVQTLLVKVGWLAYVAFVL